MQLCSDAELFLIGCGGKQEQKGRQFKELSDGRKKKEQRSEVLAAQRRAAAQVGCTDTRRQACPTRARQDTVAPAEARVGSDRNSNRDEHRQGGDRPELRARSIACSENPEY